MVLLFGACLLPGACSSPAFKSVNAVGGNSSTGGAAADGSVPEDAVPRSGLLMWLRADRGVTQDLGAVATWADQSPNHTDAIQTATNARPVLASSGIGGLPVLKFDGIDDFLKLPAGFADFTQGLSMFAVVRENPVDTCVEVMEFSNGSEIDDISLG